MHFFVTFSTTQRHLYVVNMFIFLQITHTTTKYIFKEHTMAKSKQNNHEYYANAETCRNRLFDTYNPSHLQNEDYHLNYYNEEDWEEEDD